MAVESKSDFEKEVRKYSEQFGGFGDFHIHGDRAYTRREEFYEGTGRSISEFGKLSLGEKQKLTWILHNSSAFGKESLRERMRRMIDDSLSFGVNKLYTTVDVTYNTGLRSLEVAEELKKEFEGKIDLKIGAYNPSGFKTGEKYKDRFELFEEAARRSDFLMGLAEKDRPKDHIGEQQHNWYLLNMGYKLGKPVHFHVGQENKPSDRTLELLMTDLEQIQDLDLRVSPKDFPEVVVVHAISSSCLPEEEFDIIAERMKERNVSLISCPRAAISMLQDSSVHSPIHNSIGNVWRFAAKGVHIKGLGVDNLDDIYIPASSPDVYDEVEDLANSLRFYNPKILAKVACGQPLDPFDIGIITETLFDKN